MIRLFKCYQCWYVFDDAILYAGKHTRCSCGSEHFRQVPPTLINILYYLLFQKTHAVKRILARS
jgi:rubredoxin